MSTSDKDYVRKMSKMGTKCPSFGSEKIGVGSSVNKKCDFCNVCRYRGYCVVARSLKVDVMNARFKRRHKTRKD